MQLSHARDIAGENTSTSIDLDQDLVEDQDCTDLTEAEADDILAELDVFDELDNLLKESLELKKAEASAKSRRLQLKRANLTKEERKDLEVKVRAWEVQREWNVTANVAVFERQTCGCGQSAMIYSHLMHQQVHKHKAITRLIRAELESPTAANMVAVQSVTTRCCADCAGAKGFDITKEGMTWTL